MPEPAQITADLFERHQGDEFGVGFGDESLPPIRLDEVSRLSPDANSPRPDPFSLVFSGPPPIMEQRTYALSHPTLGPIDIFLVPIGVDGEGRVRYEAVFN